MTSQRAWVVGLVVASACASPPGADPAPVDRTAFVATHASEAVMLGTTLDHDGGSNENGSDGQGSGCGTPSHVLFDTATLPATQDFFPARLVDLDNFVGVRFTLTEPHDITALGAHIFDRCATCSGHDIAIAVVPLDPATQLPRTIDLSDALGYAVGPLPLTTENSFDPTPPSLELPVSFTLPAGTYGLVIATGVLGANAYEGDMPIDVTQIGTPQFFHCYSDGGVGDVCSWADDINPDPHRMFVVGR